jgi:hypothetical protein
MNYFANSARLFSVRDIATTLAISAGYLLLSAMLIGFKPEQLFLVALFNVCYYASAGSRKFIIGFSIFIVYWIIFDYMKAFPNYRYNTVHIESLYNTEKNLFGIHVNGTVLSPNEYWSRHSNSFLDVMSGVFYLCWVPVPLLFAGYMFFKNRQQFLQFSFTFLLVNIIGFILYYVYPAAPPWYVAQYGFAFEAHTPGNTAGLQRFDDFFNVHVFQSLYAKSSNVFAAVPSLHASYPVVLLYYGVKNRLGLINILFVLVMLGIWFSAVYTSHHYVLDVLAGILCATTAILLFQRLLMRQPGIAAAFSKMLRKIE